jgi:hypothetical protein
MYVRNGLWRLALAFLLIISTIPLLASQAMAVEIGKPAPEVTGKGWINSRGLTLKELRNRVVLIEFWTYG